jgi:hypothetical protein
VHLLAHVSLSETSLDADTYRESDNTALAYVVELVAAELLTRPGRTGSQEHSPALDAHVTEEARRIAHEAALLKSFRRWRSARGSAEPESAARGRAAMQHLSSATPAGRGRSMACSAACLAIRGSPTRWEEELGFVAGAWLTFRELKAADSASRIVVRSIEARCRRGRLSRTGSPRRPPRCMHGRRASLPFPQLRKRGGPRSRAERRSHLVRSRRLVGVGGDDRNQARLLHKGVQKA